MNPDIEGEYKISVACHLYLIRQPKTLDDVYDIESNLCCLRGNFNCKFSCAYRNLDEIYSAGIN